jgi:indolepyruvate ferredoxin oxidoreductase
VPDVNAFIAARNADLSRYWNDDYARRYVGLLEKTRAAAGAVEDGEALLWAVARSAYKLMAYKDEYEVARLYTDGRFRAALADEFGSMRAVRIHLSPPLLARRDPNTGRPRKMVFGAWILVLFRLLASLRGLREGPLDIFARSHDRRLERRLRDLYLAEVERRVTAPGAEDFAETLALARAPLEVRGFGPVKQAAAEALIARLSAPARTPDGQGRLAEEHANH